MSANKSFLLFAALSVKFVFHLWNMFMVPGFDSLRRNNKESQSKQNSFEHLSLNYYDIIQINIEI